MDGEFDIPGLESFGAISEEKMDLIRICDDVDSGPCSAES